MSWSPFESQRDITRNLKLTVQSKKVPNAYIFFGPDGVGKESMAISFAKSLNCEALSKDADPCNTCKNCKSFNDFFHPDFEFIFPVESTAINKTNSRAAENYKTLLFKKKQNPFFKAKMDKATGILVSQIENAIQKTSFYPAFGKYRVLLISQVDLMREDAAAKLLKTLEEPPSSSIFILVCSKIQKIIPTIRSRCQQIKFKALSREEILLNLKHQFPNLDNDFLSFLSSYSKGSYARAIELASSDQTKYIDLRNQAISFLRHIVSPSGYLEMVEFIERLSKPTESREKRFRILEFILSFFHDSIRQAKLPHSDLSNSDISETIDKFSKLFSTTDLLASTKHVEQTIYELSRNANPTLALFNLAANLRKCLRL